MLNISNITTPHYQCLSTSYQDWTITFTFNKISSKVKIVQFLLFSYHTILFYLCWQIQSISGEGIHQKLESICYVTLLPITTLTFWFWINSVMPLFILLLIHTYTFEIESLSPFICTWPSKVQLWKMWFYKSLQSIFFSLTWTRWKHSNKCFWWFIT